MLELLRELTANSSPTKGAAISQNITTIGLGLSSSSSSPASSSKKIKSKNSPLDDSREEGSSRETLLEEIIRTNSGWMEIKIWQSEWRVAADLDWSGILFVEVEDGGWR